MSSGSLSSLSREKVFYSPVKWRAVHCMLDLALPHYFIYSYNWSRAERLDFHRRKSNNCIAFRWIYLYWLLVRVRATFDERVNAYPQGYFITFYRHAAGGRIFIRTIRWCYSADYIFKFMVLDASNVVENTSLKFLATCTKMRYVLLRWLWWDWRKGRKY